MAVTLRNRFYGCSLLLPLTLAVPGTATELRVRVSQSVVEQYRSVGITVTDPLGGLDAGNGPLRVTMADAGDHRFSFQLAPTGRPGEWSGRFTPTRAGRHTGAVMLDRGDQKDLGLVPLIRVRPSHRPGFLRLHPSSRRLLQWTRGGALFPIGVRVAAEDLGGTDWRAEVLRLRSHGLNFLQIELPGGDDPQALRAVDTALLAAEQSGGLGVLLRFGPPDTPADAAAYEEHLRDAVARWAYSPALAGWYLAAEDAVSANDRVRWAQVIRDADPYRHLLALPGVPGEVPPGADFAVAVANWQQPGNRFALMERSADGTPVPLPGEDCWQMLALGGIGVPLVPYHPGAPESTQVVGRLAHLARMARTVPYGSPGTPLAGLLPVDSPGSVVRYGRTIVGWMAPGAARVLNLPGLPRGRYRARFWDTAREVEVPALLVWSSGSLARLELPAGVQTVYFQVEPAREGAAPASSAARGHSSRKRSLVGSRSSTRRKKARSSKPASARARSRSTAKARTRRSSAAHRRHRHSARRSAHRRSYRR